MSRLEKDGWQLEDGVKMHAADPAAFQIPDESIRSRLVPASNAKLVFILRGSDGIRSERMWVLITGYTATGYIGELDNDPHTPGAPIAAGDVVEFGPEHVIDALPPDNWNAETQSYE